MIWIDSCVIIVSVCITETISVIIIAAVVIAPKMIGFPVVIHNCMMIPMTSRTDDYNMMDDDF